MNLSKKISSNAEILFMLILCSFICWIPMVYASAGGGPFTVKPGAGRLSEAVKVKDFKCTFSYEAQGGTGEEWHISLDLVHKAVICTVERHASSYLYFQDFSLEVKGPGVAVTDVEVKDAQKANLNAEEYVMGDTAVSSVKGKFKNHLGKVLVYSPLSDKNEL